MENALYSEWKEDRLVGTSVSAQTVPLPNPGTETKQQWLDRCIPKMIQDGYAVETGKATTICTFIWNKALEGF